MYSLRESKPVKKQEIGLEQDMKEYIQSMRKDTNTRSNEKAATLI